MKKSSLRAKSLQRKTIVLIVSGSIAAYKIGDLVTLLRNQGARVLCVLTESAKQFVTPLVLRALSGERVYEPCDFFNPEVPHAVVHTELAEQADLIAAAPASANFIARLAAGLADDLASCIVLASKKPVLLVPAMNDQMYEHPLTQENIAKLRRIGYRFIPPVEGHLVCGKEAVGHISGFDAVLNEVQKILR